VSAVPPPPWQGRVVEPDRTPEGVEIIRTRLGAFIRNPDGPGLLPYATPEALSARLFTPSTRKKPVKLWSVWDPL
jgi:hypothetical protein